jgi:glycosyltransferase involved in cell wall biosynthesis
MSKIRILAIPSDKHGVGKYRILDPFTFIGENYTEDVHVDIQFDVPNNDDVFKNYDIVVFHSFIHSNTHEENIDRINWLKKQGIVTVMDIDDFWTVDQRHPMYVQVKTAKIAEKKIEMMKLVDYVTTTTPIFQKTIKDKLKIDKIAIFPNSINEEENQFKPNPLPSEKIRFGWLGGSSHLHDIELMKNGISSIHNSYKNKVQFVLCGFDLRGTMTEIDQTTGKINRRDLKPTETVWYRYEQMFTDDYKVLDEEYSKFLNNFVQIEYQDKDKPYVRRWTQDINKYALNYNYFDVSLAPLIDSVFNSNKSQLKAIEAGFHKKAIIASEVQPYTLDLVNILDNGKFNSKGNALLVSPNRNHKDWAKLMKKLIENPNMIEDMGNRLYETVKDKYSLKKVCKDRVEFFNN